MSKSSYSYFWRVAAAAGLMLTVSPILVSWFRESRIPAAPETALNWPAVNGEAWSLPNEIAVQLKPGVDGGILSRLAQLTGASLQWDDETSQSLGVLHFTLPAGKSMASELAALRSDSSVEAADQIHLYRTPESLNGEKPVPDSTKTQTEPTKWRPNDPRYDEQWNFAMIHAEEAWENNRGRGAVVAVIDTGVAYDNTKKGTRAKDFADTKFVPGYDFCGKDNMPNDDNGHGTHVAGTIAESTNNGEGVAGLAFEAAIMPIKVLTAQGSGRSDTIAEAIRWAADHGANIINMSLGGPFPDSLIRSACAYANKKGVTIVCAAGNSGGEGVGYPAAYPSCIAVSAVGSNGKLSFYSSWGKPVAIAAPGGDKQQDPDHGGILQNTLISDDNGGFADDYYAFQGTSMASPHVAAVAALVYAGGVHDPADIKAVLQRSAAKVDGPANKYGAGILNAGDAAHLSHEVHGDGVARFWMVAWLFAACLGIGKLRNKMGTAARYPLAATFALAFGLLFPDWLAGFLGESAHFNIIAHSELIPAFLILGLDSNDRQEMKLVGWMSFGLMLHLGWEFLRGTIPFIAGLGFWQLTPWVIFNLILGIGILVAAMRVERK